MSVCNIHCQRVCLELSLRRIIGFHWRYLSAEGDQSNETANRVHIEDGRSSFRYAGLIPKSGKSAEAGQGFDQVNESPQRVSAGQDKLWILDGGATSHCTRDIQTFETLDRRYQDTLETARKNARISGKGVTRAPTRKGMPSWMMSYMFQE